MKPKAVKAKNGKDSLPIAVNKSGPQKVYTTNKDKQGDKVTKTVVKTAKQTKSPKLLNDDNNETAGESSETVGNNIEVRDGVVNKPNSDENADFTMPLPPIESIKKKTLPLPGYSSDEDSDSGSSDSGSSANSGTGDEEENGDGFEQNSQMLGPDDYLV